jgi:sugar/nucleoside kinase (ribokinase family)
LLPWGLALTRPPKGLFVGISTLDSIFGVEGFPAPNDKAKVHNWELLAGGLATNAAVAFRALGGAATLLTVLGRHPLADVIRQDLAQQEIDVRDMVPERTEPPAFASIVVTSPGGDRMATSTGTRHLPQPESSGDVVEQRQPDVVLVDGHHIPLSIDAAIKARERNIPVVVDAGSWKPGFEKLLPLCDAAICAELFRPPGVSDTESLLDYLTDLQIPYRAVTHGDQPIVYRSPDGDGTVSIDPIEAVDTLGAGDIYHGAFAYEWATGVRDFPAALKAASRVAGLSCQHFGTRSWIEHL